MVLILAAFRSRLRVSTTHPDPPISHPLSRIRLASHPIQHRVHFIRARAANQMLILLSRGARRHIPLVRVCTRARARIPVSRTHPIQVSHIPETAARLEAQLISRVELASPLAQHISLGRSVSQGPLAISQVLSASRVVQGIIRAW